MGEKVHAPQDVMEAVRFITKSESNAIKAFRESRIEQLKGRAFICAKATEEWGNSLSHEQKAAQGEINLPHLAHMLNEPGTGGQEWVTQVTEGFPVIGE